MPGEQKEGGKRGGGRKEEKRGRSEGWRREKGFKSKRVITIFIVQKLLLPVMTSMYDYLFLCNE